MQFKFISTFLFIVALLLATTNVFCQQNLEFIENKGQWDKTISFRGELTTGAFSLKADGGYRLMQYDTTNLKGLYNKIHPHNLPVEASENRDETNIVEDFNYTLKGHVYEVKFVNANPSPIALPDKQIECYNNYFIGTDSTKWAGNCRIFNAVTYKNLYPNIDIRYYTDKGNIKYDFIIHPGGNPNDIIMYVDGADNLGVRKGQLAIKTSVGEIRETIPSSFQFNNRTGRKEVSCSYKVNGNIVHFNVQSAIEKDATLIIDPQWIFSTFTGSRSDNWGYSATYDAAGNFYAGGIVFGAGFPVTNGAFQQSFAKGNGGTGESSGGFDIGIMKFNALGTARVYATYLGGSGNEYPHSMVVDANNNLIISGKTTSADYPANREHFGTSTPSSANFDIILTKLNASGTALVGSMVIGGAGNDGVNVGNKYSSPYGPQSIRLNYGDDSRSEVIVDSIGNIYLASCTQSLNFPVKNAIQINHSSNTTGSYNQDAIILKTSPDLSDILFSTYLGGSGDDAAFVLAFDPTSNTLAVAGATTSRDFPGDTINTLFPHYKGGQTDGFITLMSTDGSKLYHTSYLGTSGNDIVFGVQYDKVGYPYIVGTTTGNWPVVNANFKQAGGKQFIAKLQKDLSGFVYSTTFGTGNSIAPNISPIAFLVDRCENVYVSGWGGKGNTIQNYSSAGTLGLSVTNDAIKRSTDGSDFYFFVLEHNANSQLYGSFFGQDGGRYPDHVDGGTSRFDKNGVIYQALCANCEGGAVFPTTGGVAYPNNGSQGCNLAAVKIAFNLAGVGAEIRSKIKGIAGKIVGCVPLTATFSDAIGEGKTYQWDFGDNSGKVTTTKPTINHTFNDVGSYRVSLVSIDSSACNIADTSSVVLKVANNEAILKLSASKTGDCSSKIYLFDNASSALSPFKSNSFTLYFGDGTQQDISAQTISHTYPAEGTYKASLWLNDATYCNAPDSIQYIVRIAQNVKAIITTDAIGCAPYDATIINSSLGGEIFNWDFGDGLKYTGADINLSHQYKDTGTYVIELEAIDNSTCNKISNTSFPITVQPKPVAAFSFSPNPPKANTDIVFTNQSIEAKNYIWIFDDGDTLITSNASDPISHTFNASQTYRVTLIALSESGCADTIQHDIKALVTPIADVANAITPNGINRTVQVRGYGIDKMKWVIYNRWGQKVFETSNVNDAWDGKLNGQILAPDVYTYTLDVTFTSRDHIKKTGDITLLK